MLAKWYYHEYIWAILVAWSLLYLHHRSTNYAGIVYHPIPLFNWGKFTCLCFASLKFVQKRGIYNTKAVRTSENERVTQTATNDDHPCPATVVFMNSSGDATASETWRTLTSAIKKTVTCPGPCRGFLSSFCYWQLSNIVSLASWPPVSHANSFSKELVPVSWYGSLQVPEVFVVARRPVAMQQKSSNTAFLFTLYRTQG